MNAKPEQPSKVSFHAHIDYPGTYISIVRAHGDDSVGIAIPPDNGEHQYMNPTLARAIGLLILHAAGEDS